jgi:serine/threonine-protein kinase
VSQLSPGDLVSGKYRVVRLIGDGGMGVVYEARHEVLGSRVALKFLHAELAKRPGLAQRFLQEARVSATIQSPHVTHVTDVDTTQDGSPYLVMELLTGQPLQRLLDQQGKLPQDQALDFALQILAGLEAAHAMGVVHRDLKPDNVFVTPSGGGPLLKLIDFGIAKLRATSEYTKGLTRAGVVMGTPEYMAPEQLYSAHTTDLRADLYSLGVMLFEMLAGVRPADGDDVDHIVAAVEAGNVRKLSVLAPSVPPALAQLVERATAAQRDARFASAAELRLALAPFAGQLSHAGRLAAMAPPLEPAAPPLSDELSSFPAPPASVVAAVPKTLPPDASPLSVSQLGAARTSISEPAPQLSQFGHGAAGATAPGGAPYAAPAPPYAAPPYAAPPSPYAPPAQQAVATPRRRRSGLILIVLVVAVLGGGGAVGYAAYVAADRERTPTPPLPDVTVTLPGTEPTVEALNPLNPDVTPGQPVATSAPQSGPRPSQPPTTQPGNVGAGGGAAAPGGTPPATTGQAPPFQLPFPLPSNVAIPTALPSSIQLPPGFPNFPSGLPGAQPPTTTTPTSAPPPAAPAPAPAPAPTPTRKPQSTGTKP